MTICRRCAGRGQRPEEDVICYVCDGKGRITFPEGQLDEYFKEYRKRAESRSEDEWANDS